MAGYALRYYKDFGVQDAIVRVEIHKLYAAVEFAPAPIEIGGVLAAMRLHLQGDQGDVADPIVKTSLEMSLVDAPGSEYGRFTGPYEEFFTPNSTEYLFKVFIDGVLEWSGYLTPDSFEEDITAYGVVTITARDNIGHLQDFMFDEQGNSDGMISVQEIFTKAWQLIASTQTLLIAEEPDVVWPECYGYKPYELMLNVEAFEDKNWFEVMESVLDSLGLVLRYVGHNEFRIYPLRSLPLLDKSYLDDVESQPVVFKATGHRCLKRACKKIVDNLKYEIGDIYSFNLKDKDYSRTSLLINGKIVDSWEPSEASFWMRNGNIGIINPYEFGKNPRGGASFANPTNLFVSVLKDIDISNCLMLSRSFMAGELIMDLSFKFDGRFYSAGYSGQYISIGSAREQTVTAHYAVECFTCVNNSCGHYWFDAGANEFVIDSGFSGIRNDFGAGSWVLKYNFKAGQRYTVSIDTATALVSVNLLNSNNASDIQQVINSNAASGVFEFVANNDALYIGGSVIRNPNVADNVVETDLSANVVTGYYTYSSQTVGSYATVSKSSDGAWRCIAQPVVAGEKYYITGTGGGGARLYCYMNSAGIIKAIAPSSDVQNNKEIVIDEAGILYCTFNRSAGYSLRQVKTVAIVAKCSISIGSVADNRILSAELGYGFSSSKGRYGEQSLEIKHNLRIPEGTTALNLRFLGFTATVVEGNATVRPSNTPIKDLIESGLAYCRISDLKLSQADANDFKESKVISLYDETNNNLITRNSTFGSGPVVLSPKVIRNGIYLPESGYPPATPWNWPEEDVKTELRVLIAQQILLYNSKPNNLLTGVLVSEDKMLRLPGIWTYNGKNHIMISGSLDFLTGYLEDVRLREYTRYNNVYPEQFKLTTEDSSDVLTEDSETIVIGFNNK